MIIGRLIVLASLLMLLGGCATQQYVKEQIKPLSDRVDKLEMRVSDLEMKTDKIKGTADETSRKVDKAFELQMMK